jgi:Domain of unknown function (DU1801)
MKAFGSPQVAAAFKSYPADVRPKLLAVRELIFKVASTAGVGKLEETLKWGEPAYLTPSGSGSTIRIGTLKSDPDCYAMNFNCQSSLVQTFREKFPDRLHYEANRSILFRVGERIPVRELSACIAMALTYHRDKKPRRSARMGRL